MTYQVVLHRTEVGISVSVPGLPGCWSEGDTEEEALINIANANSEHLAVLKDLTRGEEVREVEVVVDSAPQTVSKSARFEIVVHEEAPTIPECCPREIGESWHPQSRYGL